MKCKLAILALMIYNMISGQDLKIEFNQLNMFEGETINNVPNQEKDVIYGKTLEWVAYNFRNTESVIQSSVENKMLRFQGVSNSIITSKFYTYGLSYLIQIDIKDEKVKYHVYDINSIAANGVKYDIELSLLYYGDSKKKKHLDKVQKMKNEINIELNNIYDNYIDFLLNDTTNDNW
ncbi:DUF4468 domain-containing protein [Lutimonas halocynthiae]|uniref:DUF4468 domain-containing protein n=1 Tax=Lutimonas halocynthiae TaxID=1446477 RepID=UPI0025B56D04|nr:DUF4468 domain-containing protein [Lutimonas halocynthiae]MDN3643742.1 DUF4468 domain-containing protein [Lutimonas halocynthiae]